MVRMKPRTFLRHPPSSWAVVYARYLIVMLYHHAIRVDLDGSGQELVIVDSGGEDLV